MNLCVNCKHFVRGYDLDPRAPFCAAPQSSPVVDPVYGYRQHKGAKEMRARSDSCTEAGVWFVQKTAPARPPKFWSGWWSDWLHGKTESRGPG